MKCKCGADYMVLEKDGGLMIRCKGECYEKNN